MPEQACAPQPAVKSGPPDADQSTTVFRQPSWPWTGGAVILFIASLAVGSHANAQVGATISVDSDYRYRARSLSTGRPVATIALSYDDRSGTYTGAAVTGLLSGPEAGGLVSQQIYAGYAWPITSDVDLDAGISAYRYTSLHSAGKREFFGEAYIGATAGDVSAYVRYAPDYYGQAGPVVYFDLATNSEIAEATRFYTHAGLLLQASGAPTLGGRRSRYDVHAGVAREFGRLTVKAELAVGGPDDAYFGGVWRGRSSLTIGIQSRF